MKQLILIVPAISCKLNVEETKDFIKTYVGTRIIEEDCVDGVPGILLKEQLSNEDKIYLKQKIFNQGEGTLAFISYDETIINVDSLDYINAMITI